MYALKIACFIGLLAISAHSFPTPGGLAVSGAERRVASNDENEKWSFASAKRDEAERRAASNDENEKWSFASAKRDEAERRAASNDENEKWSFASAKRG